MTLDCVVDDSALIAGLKEDSDDGIRGWVRGGWLNLLVPLYTLERLNAQKASALATAATEAQVVLEWLDEVTSQEGSQYAGIVELQGPCDQYMDWSQVERFLLPDTPLSSTNLEVDSLADTLDAGLDLTDTQDIETETDFAGGLADSNYDILKGSKGRDASPAKIPAQVRPLLNFVVWRTNHGRELSSTKNTIVLLTEDLFTQRQASKFGVRAKLLNQVRAIVARDRQLRPGTANSAKSALLHKAGIEDSHVEIDDETASVESAQDNLQYQDLMNPDHFGRSSEVSPRGAVRGRAPARGRHTNGPARARNTTSPQMRPASHRGGVGHGTRRAFDAQRGGPNKARGLEGRARPSSGDRSSDKVPHKNEMTSQKTMDQPAGRHATSTRGKFAHSTASTPTRGKAFHVDPDSFDRPSPRGRRGRGSLWQPT